MRINRRVPEGAVILDTRGKYAMYAVARDGNIYNVKTGRIRKAFFSKGGLRRVQIQKMNGRRHFYMCRLVANVFVPNPNGFTEVYHKNGDLADDRAENLEWIGGAND